MHERFEALSILQKESKHSNFDTMLKQMIDKLPLLIVNAMNRCLLDEILRLITAHASIATLDLTLDKILSVKSNDI